MKKGGQTLGEYITEIRARYSNEPHKIGRLFEDLMCRYLSGHRDYPFAKVVRWANWAAEHGGKTNDTGIDLVATTDDGEHWAVQCKCYAPDSRVQKSDIDSFFTASGKSYGGIRFAARLIISTTDLWSSNAEEALKNQNPPCQRPDLDELINADFDVDTGTILKRKKHAVALKQARPHQQKAIADVMAGFKSADRGKLIMACGTGKTFTALKITEQLIRADKKGGAVLFLVPSLSLLSQTLREWSGQKTIAAMRFLAVCSDSKAGKDEEDIQVHDLQIPPTTDAALLRQKFNKIRKNAGTVVIFSTYHSIGVITEAQKRGMPAFDLVICDEAHRTTGVEADEEQTSHFSVVINADELRARKRLFMTATPRIYKEEAKSRAQKEGATVYDMNDPEQYGEEFHRLNFSAAVTQGLLTDYKVLVLVVGEQHINSTLQSQLAGSGEIPLSDAAKIIGCRNGLAKKVQSLTELDATDNAPMRRAVAFARNIKSSEHITKIFNDIVSKYQQQNPDSSVLTCEVRHTDGKQNAMERNRKLRWLKGGADSKIAENECRILSNVRCLSEGVDVPALDAVIFLNPRQSKIDIVQSVGRVMRRAPGKDYGYIILPIVTDVNMPPEQALDKNKNYNVVWDVLQALRSHDDRSDAEINKIELNNQKSERIHIGGVGLPEADTTGTQTAGGSPVQPVLTGWTLENVQSAIFARVVKKCGSRRYWKDWAKDVADIARTLITRITALVDGGNADCQKQFKKFLAELKQNLNPNIGEKDAVKMLAQHIITEPVFDALFGNYNFSKHNPVSKTMQAMLDILEDENLQSESKVLEEFYESVRQRAAGIDNAEGRQTVIIELYENFFKKAFKQEQEALGIVYTPVEVVDFILHSIDGLLKKHFGQTIASEDVHLLDPFTGTGTFITRLLQSETLLPADKLKHKYTRELHANEIVLLAYYIAAINIESAYHSRTGGKYTAFKGIVLTDTFFVNENEGKLKDFFQKNTARLQKQKGASIRVVFGNPPYSAKQQSAADDNRNLKYPNLDKDIEDTYVRYSAATNKSNLYDSYLRAFRWASNRVEEGIVAFISNASYIDSNNMDGFRKTIADEFSEIYCFNLRGNARTQGEIRRKERGNVFGEGTRTPVVITFLVKKPGSKGKCKIHYHDIGDYLTQEEKLNTIKQYHSFAGIGWRRITPNKHYDWINQRSGQFADYVPLGDKTNNKNTGCQTATSVFLLYSGGVKTHRDSWVYNFGRQQLGDNMKGTIDFYNQQRLAYHRQKGKTVKDFIRKDPTRIHWDPTNQKDLGKNTPSRFNDECIRPAIYRPFAKQHLYFHSQWNTARHRQPSIYPSATTSIRTICVPGLGASTDFSALMVDTCPDVNLLPAGCQCFPRHYYKKSGDCKLLGDGDEGKIDNIPAATVALFRQHYGNRTISGDDIFYYVYAVLHNAEYKAKYAADLKKMLPRIPHARTAADFRHYAAAGKQLADLHCGYETLDPNLSGTIVTQTGDITAATHYHVCRMRVVGENKTAIQYNPNITITNIPPTAHDYIVNGKSALDWVVERYQTTTHADSGITNNPNHYSDDPRYILNLLRRVIHISTATVAITKTLPPLNL